MLSPEQLKPGTTLREILRVARRQRRLQERPDGAKFVDDGCASFNAGSRRRSCELADGRFISVLRRPMPDGSLVSTHEDITEREKLKPLASRTSSCQREEELCACLRRRPQQHVAGPGLYDAEQRVVIANERYAEIYGLTPDQVQPGTTLRQIVEYRIANGGHGGADPEPHQGAAGGLRRGLDQVYRLSDGRDICVSRQPMRGGGWVTTHQDVSEREKLKARLERQNEQLDAALNNMSQGLAMFDEEQRLVVCNRLYGEMYKLTEEQVEPGTTVRQILQYRLANGSYRPPDPAAFVDDLANRFGKLPSDIHKLADGRVIHVTYRKAAHGGHVITHEDITERQKLMAQLEKQHQLLKEHEEQLRAQNVQLDAALNNMVQGLAMFDAEQRVVICNERYADDVRAGARPGEARHHAAPDLRVPHRQRLYAGKNRRRGAGRGTPGRARLHRHPRARRRALHQRLAAADGRGGTVTTHQDITERQKLHAELEENNKPAQRADLAPAEHHRQLPGRHRLPRQRPAHRALQREGAAAAGPSRALFADGPPSLEACCGSMRPRRVRSRRRRGAVLQRAWPSARPRRPHVFERERPDGTVLEVRGVPLEDGGFVTTYMDITERRRSEAKIAHMALHDALTGLANRVLLNERLEQALARVKRGEIVAMHLLDLDHFKNVNDTLGHPAGDKLLKDVADRLRGLVRETDTIARMGGDEFAIMQVAIGAAGRRHGAGAARHRGR